MHFPPGELKLPIWKIPWNELSLTLFDIMMVRRALLEAFTATLSVVA